jgi:ATP-binding cassette subfamily F protein 3
METINALAGALESFHGGVLIISHDQFFIKRVCKEIWVIGDGEVTDFRESFDEYKRLALIKHKRNMATKK